jgi:hypothetical protein
VRAELDHRWLADFRSVAGTPGASRGLFVGGVGLEGGQRLAAQAGEVLDSRDAHARDRRAVATESRHRYGAGGASGGGGGGAW